MPKFAANLTMLYNEHDFIERFAAAAADGFEAVEYLFPYAYKKELLADMLQEHGLTQALHNMPAGDWAARRARHRLPARPRGGVPRQRHQRHRVRDRPGLQAGQLPRRHPAQGRARGRGPQAPSSRICATRRPSSPRPGSGW